MSDFCNSSETFFFFFFLAPTTPSFLKFEALLPFGGLRQLPNWPNGRAGPVGEVGPRVIYGSEPSKFPYTPTTLSNSIVLVEYSQSF